MSSLDALLAPVGSTDISLVAIVLFVLAALFVYAHPSDDEQMNRTGYVTALIGIFAGLYVLTQTLNLLGQASSEPLPVPRHVVTVAMVAVAAAFVVAWRAFLASIGTSLLVSAIVLQGSLGLFAATLNTLARTMADCGWFGSIAKGLAFIEQFARYLVFFAGAVGLLLGGIAALLSICRVVKARHPIQRYRLVHQ
jgi:hypothetical protein